MRSALEAQRAINIYLWPDGAEAQLGDGLPANATLRDLGLHRLKDLRQPEELFQVAHPDLPDAFPPLRSLDTQAHNLPVHVTNFIGREREMADIRHLLSIGRLVTLMGAGGSGKTRLALHVAADVVDEFADGVWLVELAALADPSLVPQTVASTLGVREQPGRSMSETLTDHLRRRQVLLVLDNCEHLIVACAQLAEAVLRRCPRVGILATTREALGCAATAEAML